MGANVLFAQAAQGSNPLATVGMIGAMVAIVYFVMIRPQQKQLKDHKALLSSLKKGDDVVTQGGVLGRIYAVTEKVVTLEVANGVRIRVLKSSIQAKGQAEASEEVKAPEKKEEK